MLRCFWGFKLIYQEGLFATSQHFCLNLVRQPKLKPSKALSSLFSLPPVPVFIILKRRRRRRKKVSHPIFCQQFLSTSADSIKTTSRNFFPPKILFFSFFLTLIFLPFFFPNLFWHFAPFNFGGFQWQSRRPISTRGKIFEQARSNQSPPGHSTGAILEPMWKSRVKGWGSY